MSQILKPPEGGFSAAMCRRDLAVVIVDMQAEHLSRPPFEKRKRVVAAHQEVISLSIKHDIPVAVLELKGCGLTIPQLEEPLRAVPRRVRITKSKPDGFEDTELQSVLRTWNAEIIVLTGLMASACVLFTARSALSFGFKVRITEPLVGDEDCSGIDPRFAKWYREQGLLRPPELATIFGSD